ALPALYSCVGSFLFFLSLRLPPTSTLFPYTTLFRSEVGTEAAFLYAPPQIAVRGGDHVGLDLDLPLTTHRCDAAFLEDPKKLRRSEEHTSELQSRENLVCRLLLEKKKNISNSVIREV